MKMARVKAIIFAAALIVIMAIGCTGPAKSSAELQAATNILQKAIQARLLALDNDVSDAAGKIARTGLQGQKTREILSVLCTKYPFVTDCSAVDPGGKMITVAPDEYRRFEGTETAKTEASKQFFKDFNARKKPLLSSLFRAVEGFDGIVLVWPVVTAQGEVLGSVSALFKPEALLDDIIGPVARARGIKINVAQTDGMTIYCSNGKETGLNLLTDPRYKAYPELLAMGRQMVARETGMYEYTFADDATGKPVRKMVFWTSIGLNGTEWRLVSIAELN